MWEDRFSMPFLGAAPVATLYRLVRRRALSIEPKGWREGIFGPLSAHEARAIACLRRCGMHEGLVFPSRHVRRVSTNEQWKKDLVAYPGISKWLKWGVRKNFDPFKPQRLSGIGVSYCGAFWCVETTERFYYAGGAGSSAGCDGLWRLAPFPRRTFWNPPVACQRRL